ncbi:MAG: Bacterial regulatory protein gntR family [Chloroflexota bacterium]|jgi:DNA-binding FadR family transcriptional regulator
MARRSSALPEKIAQDLMRRILADEFADISILPSERILQASYGVSRTVARDPEVAGHAIREHLETTRQGLAGASGRLHDLLRTLYSAEPLAR